MGKYFGTDGVRGVANQDLTPDLAFRLGRAVASRLRDLHPGGGWPRVMVGRDTRRSGTMLEAALAAGVTSVGVDVWRLGVVPTPAVAWLTRHKGASAGAMISASHNPAPDNGIKFFGPEGFKLPDAEEEAIEIEIDRLVSGDDRLDRPTGAQLGQVIDAPELIEDYVEHLKGIVPTGLEGYKLAVDCAHGAATVLAPRVLQELGAEVMVLGASPDGDNINAGYGSTHLSTLSRAVKSAGLPLGLAFDGDADRLLAVDQAGELVDGDRILWICLRHMRTLGLLDRADIVATVMSNLGLEQAVAREGGELIRTRVGDRYVLEEMLSRGIELGGEQSGHLIFLAHNTTGDGLVSALRLLSALGPTGSLQGMAAKMPLYPQVLENVRVARAKEWNSHPALTQALASAEERLGATGRILVRASGTEPLLRVMVEGADGDLILEIAQSLCQVARDCLGEASSAVPSL